MTRKAPEIIEVTDQRIEELLERAASNTLRDDDMELIPGTNRPTILQSLHLVTGGLVPTITRELTRSMSAIRNFRLVMRSIICSNAGNR